MSKYDINYFASTLSSLCGVPARIYNKNKLKEFYSLVNFPVDPFILIEDNIKNIKDNIGYLNDNNFFYYGYVRYLNNLIIIGPVRIIKPDNKLFSKLILDLNIDKKNITEFKEAISSLTPMPLESLMEALLSLNYVLNNEKKSLSEILINYDKSNKLSNNQIINYSETRSERIVEHNTYHIEENILRMVSNGKVVELNQWLKNAHAVKGGIVSNDALRQLKNIFITTITLASRAAIKGGLDVNEALSLSDLYIQKMELMNSYTDIETLQVNMLVDYTEKVAKIRGNSNCSQFLININKYIYNHISEPIKSNDICKELFISKSTLFDKIKKETDKTLDEYILNLKINESKNLLKYSTQNISTISIYLGFSSQSHFNNTFKKITGLTPKQYKNSQ